MIDKQLTRNFKLSEFVDSNIATRKKYAEQYQLTSSIANNIESLVVNLIQPLRDLLPDGIIHISSGYRCARVNKDAGGKPNSQHLQGLAADCTYYEGGVKNNAKLLKTLFDSGMVYDQAIEEYNGSWAHLSYVTKRKNRMMHFDIN